MIEDLIYKALTVIAFLAAAAFTLTALTTMSLIPWTFSLGFWVTLFVLARGWQ